MAANLAILIVLTVLGAEPDDALKRLDSRDAEERVAAVKILRDTPGDRVSTALVRTLSDREISVREAVLDALGERGDEICVKALRRALKTFARERDVLPLVVQALGAARDVASAGAIVKLARRGVGSEPWLADAAIDALGQLRHREAIDGLVELLGTAQPVRGGANARTGHERYVAGIRESLKELTGLPFKKTVTWQIWWRHAHRSWLPTPQDPRTETGAKRHDHSWRFGVTRPDTTRWAFMAPKGAALRVRYVGSREEAGFAWIDVMVHATAEREPATVGDAARLHAERLKKELADVKEIALGEKARLGSETVLSHRAVGMLAGGRVARRRVFFVARNGLLYTVSVHVSSGASERVGAEIGAMLKSFRLLDR
jgi:HEAT repeats/PBS lyase HEAT-like repeat